MDNKRHYHVIIGSKDFFDENIPYALENSKLSDFIDLVKRNDRKSARGIENETVKDLIVRMTIIVELLMAHTIVWGH